MWDLWVAGAAAPAFEGSESWRFYPRLRLPEGFSRHRHRAVWPGNPGSERTDKMCYMQMNVWGPCSRRIKNFKIMTAEHSIRPWDRGQPGVTQQGQCASGDPCVQRDKAGGSG